MKIANFKGLVARTAILSVAAGVFILAGTPKAQAQHFGVAVQVGQPAYQYDSYNGGGGRYDRDGDRYNRDGDRYDRGYYQYAPGYFQDRHEMREREEREEFARRQAFIRQQQWENAQRYGNRYGDR